MARREREARVVERWGWVKMVEKGQGEVQANGLAAAVAADGVLAGWAACPMFGAWFKA